MGAPPARRHLVDGRLRGRAAGTSTCDRRCHACDYCGEVLEQVLVDFGGV